MATTDPQNDLMGAAPPRQSSALSASSYKGITYDDGKWRVRINVASKQWHVGR